MALAPGARVELSKAKSSSAGTVVVLLWCGPRTLSTFGTETTGTAVALRGGSSARGESSTTHRAAPSRVADVEPIRSQLGALGEWQLWLAAGHNVAEARENDVEPSRLGTMPRFFSSAATSNEFASHPTWRRSNAPEGAVRPEEIRIALPGGGNSCCCGRIDASRSGAPDAASLRSTPCTLATFAASSRSLSGPCSTWPSARRGVSVTACPAGQWPDRRPRTPHRPSW